MRVNVYAEEMTNRLEIISKEADGHTFTGLRFYLELPATIQEGPHKGENVQGPFIHRPGDDDSAAVTFWGKRDLRRVLLKALAALDEHYGYPRGRGGVLEVGCDEDTCEVVINHPDLHPDADGVGHIVFSAKQAMNLSSLLIEFAMRAEQLKIAREGAMTRPSE